MLINPASAPDLITEIKTLLDSPDPTDRVIELIKELKEYLRWSATEEALKLGIKLDAEIPKKEGIRVYAYSDEILGVQADQMVNPSLAYNATLILDDGVEL
jgi:hypothetical protein